MELYFFAFHDHWLFAENYANYIGSGECLGRLDEYEVRVLLDFWENFSGMERGEWYPSVIKIRSYQVAPLLSKLKVFATPDNLWHREVKEKIIVIFEKAIEVRMGLLIST